MSNWSGNSFVDALLVGRKVGDSNIKVYFATYDAAWTNVEKSAAMSAFQSWADVANLTFTETASRGSADFVENLQNLPSSPGSLGVHNLVIDYNTGSITGHNLQLEGTFNSSGYGWDRNDANGGLSVGGFGYATLVHEFGHGLGLDHTHRGGAGDPHVFAGVSSDTDSGDNQLNQDVFSVMSYVDGINTKSVDGRAGRDDYGFVGGPMAFDIAAIQFMYGANTSKNSGNNTYTLPHSNSNGTYFSAIWDTGGIDEIVYHGGRDVKIDLRSATLQNEVGGGGYLSSVGGIKGGFTIAADFTDALADQSGETGVIIENATGGSGDDTITGNKADNKIHANSGNDVISSGAGNDKVYDGSGSDTVNLGDGNDYILVGGGVDSYDGGSGYDYISYYYSTGGVTLDLAANTASGARAGGDTINSFEGASGSKTGHDRILGTSGNNTIKTYGGNDKVYDRGGSDRVYLGDGNDYVLVGGGVDLYDGGSGYDYISYYYSTGGVTLDLAANTASGSRADGDTISSFEGASGSKTGNDKILGTSGNNTIKTYGGNDKVYDRGGDDRVYLGDGNDYVLVGGGVDLYDGGSGTDYISYYSSAGGVTLDLAANTASGSRADGDTINSFEGASGSKTGHDKISGTSGNNTIKTYGGNDKVYDRGGNDLVYLGDGNDYVLVGGGVDLYDGGTGYDYISYYYSPGGVTLDLAANTASGSRAGGDTINSFEGASGSKTGDDNISGTSGNNAIRTYGGNDTLDGRGGVDQLYAGKGDDTITGGTGSDTFHFVLNDDQDVILDFEDNVDIIEFKGFGLADAADALTYATDVGGDVVFDFGGGDTLTIENTTKAVLVDDIAIV